ncbi:MAG: T9SS type A sorting domain-containing protein [Bacteroidia bacterium]
MRFLRISIFTFIALFSAAQTGAQIVTDHLVHPEPAPPALPSAGGTFTDPTFNTTLLRVTDAGDGNDNHHAYSYWPCMNMNSTRLYLMQTNIGPTLYDFDPVGFGISNKHIAFPTNCPSGAPPNAEDAIWSDVDPNIIFVHDLNMHLYKYNVSTLSYTLLKDMSASFPAGAHSWQMNKNHTNDDLFTFTWKDASWSVTGVFAWRSSSDQFYIFNQANTDECQPDRAGNYLVVKLAASGSAVTQARIIDLSTSAISDITDGGPGDPSTPGLYWAPGHGDMGNGTVLGHDDWNNRLLGRTAANPSAFYTVMDWSGDWSQDYHGSHLSDDASWIMLSAYVSNTLPNSGLFKNEIFQVATDGSQNVRRLAHHHSDFLSDYAANGGGMAYWSSPKASISKDGNWAVFTSNWGSTTRKDVFILKIPSVATSVSNIESDKNNLMLFPNPSEGKITIHSEKEISLIEIFNMMGELIYSSKENSSSVSLNLEKENSGIYFYKVISKDQTIFTGKLIKN